MQAMGWATSDAGKVRNAGGMCLPAARAEKVNKGKRRLNRIAESSGGVRDKDHRYSPSYTSTATNCKHPGRSKHPTRGRVIGTGMHQNPNQPITGDEYDTNGRQKYILLAKPIRSG